MKKLFFAALVATVAVGGAFASQNSSRLVGFKATPSSTCEIEECDPANLGLPCTSLNGNYYQLTNCTLPIIPSGNRPI